MRGLAALILLASVVPGVLWRVFWAVCVVLPAGIWAMGLLLPFMNESPLLWFTLGTLAAAAAPAAEAAAKNSRRAACGRPPLSRAELRALAQGRGLPPK